MEVCSNKGFTMIHGHVIYHVAYEKLVISLLSLLYVNVGFIIMYLALNYDVRLLISVIYLKYLRTAYHVKSTRLLHKSSFT